MARREDDEVPPSMLPTFVSGNLGAAPTRVRILDDDAESDTSPTHRAIERDEDVDYGATYISQGRVADGTFSLAPNDRLLAARPASPPQPASAALTASAGGGTLSVLPSDAVMAAPAITNTLVSLAEVGPAAQRSRRAVAGVGAIAVLATAAAAFALLTRAPALPPLTPAPAPALALPPYGLAGAELSFLGRALPAAGAGATGAGATGAGATGAGATGAGATGAGATGAGATGAGATGAGATGAGATGAGATGAAPPEAPPGAAGATPRGATAPSAPPERGRPSSRSARARATEPSAAPSPANSASPAITAAPTVAPTVVRGPDATVNVSVRRAGESVTTEVIIDGRSAGQAPLRVALRPGRHDFEARGPRGVAKKTVDIAPGGTEKVVLDLRE